MRARVTSTRFVGRAGELAQLENALAEAAAGRPVLALLGGDSGVGKTRLLGEFERRARERGARVLHGDGLEHGEDELPFAALTAALRPLVREQDSVLQAISAVSRAELSTLLPGLDGDRGPADAMQAAGQLRLFEALLELVGALSAEAPVALVLDDLQWADRSTRTFVSFLVRNLRQEPVMLLAAYRSDDLHRRHALRPLLSELERLERARRIDLAPFDVAELTEVLSDILGSAAAPELVRRLHDRSEGNPLYTEELLAAGLDGRSPAPPSLRDAFLLRVERLSEPARRALRALARVSGLEASELNDALREAVDEQVLLTDGERLSFRHSLLREAVYDDLLPGERSALHLALATALEQRAAESSGDFAAPIAYHYAAAGEQPAALVATVAAANSALRLHAYGEAAELTERALELWARVPDAAALLHTDYVDLLSMAARAHELGGDRAREESLREAGLAELGAGADAEARRRAVLLFRLARAQWALNRGERALASAQDALELLPGDAPADRAALLAWLARTRALRGKYRDAVRDAREALQAAEAVGDLSIQGQALNTLGMALVVLGDVEAGMASLRRALEIAREADDTDGVSGAYINLADMLHLVGRTPEALATALEGLAAIPTDRRRTNDWMSLSVSDLAFESGDWALARAHLPPEDHPQVGRHRIFHELRHAELALGTGDIERAEQSLRRIDELVCASFEPQWHGLHGALLAELRRRQGDLDGARAAVQDALDRLEVCTDDVMSIARISAVGLVVEADRAQRGRDLREAADANDALIRARIHMRRLDAAAGEGGPVERAWRAQGRAELNRARGRHQPKEWAAAAGAWDALHRPYQAILARWRQTEAEAESGDRRAAVLTARTALQAAEQMGAEWVAGELHGLCRRARLDLESNGSAQATTPTEDAPFGLTERERQVLALVAQGATNRQIGAALFMAEKTASVHVSRILAKLNVHTRTQAAAVAHRLQLG